jgi:hypothetical protein
MKNIGKAKIATLSAALAVVLLASVLVVPVWAASSASANDHNRNPPAIIVSGTGTIAAMTTSTVTFIPAPGSTTADPLFVACTGNTSSPTTTTAPYLISQTGPATITGVISSNSPGTDVATSVLNPCGPSGTGTVVSTHAVYTFSSVTISLPNGHTITGGLVFTNDGDGTAVTSSGITTTLAAGHGPVTGTGGLAGITGINERSSVVVNTGSAITVSSDYWAQLNIQKGE